MGIEFNIKKLTAQAFSSHLGSTFSTWQSNNEKEESNTSLLNVREELVGQGGRGYFMTLTLEDSNGNRYTLPNEPLVSLSLRKTIKETATVGKERRGTVKEYINTEDYNISLRGLCINEINPQDYPAEQVKVLNKLFQCNEALGIVDNLFFNHFGIHKIVLKDISFEEMVGKEGIQKYSIKAVSDQDFYAELTERGEFTKK